MVCLIRFIVKKTSGSNLSHSVIGKSGCRELNPALKWFLNVCIALSARLAIWLCGGTSWNCTLWFNIVYWRTPDVSLSRIQVLGVLVGSASLFNHACFKVCAYLFLTGLPRSAFESIWKAIRMYSLPCDDLYGNLPVRSMKALLLFLNDGVNCVIGFFVRCILIELCFCRAKTMFFLCNMS